MQNMLQYKNGSSSFLSDNLDPSATADSRSWEQLVTSGKGTSYGTELFLQKQIAGDILAQKPGLSQTEVEDWTTATGYWAISRRFGFDVLDDHYLTLEDAIDTLGKSVLGLGLACARCHDHKYDPITNQDYYAIYGILESTRSSQQFCACGYLLSQK
jgi:hypothetical protein